MFVHRLQLFWDVCLILCLCLNVCLLQVPLAKGINKTVDYFRNELSRSKGSHKLSFNPDDGLPTKNYIEEDFALPHQWMGDVKVLGIVINNIRYYYK